MRTITGLIAAMLLVGLGAAPATQPTDLKAVVEMLPAEKRPSKDGWVKAERKAAGTWVSEKLAGRLLSVNTTYFEIATGDTSKAVFTSDDFKMFGVGWMIRGTAELSPNAERAGKKLRTPKMTGVVKSAMVEFNDNGRVPAIYFTVTLADVTAK